MTRYLVITIDVEPDCSPTWHYSNPLTFHGVTEGIVKRLQPLFNKYDVCPTYLINNVVLEDRGSIEAFRKLEGRFELGTHLHSEFIAPEKQFHDYAGKKGEANQCFLKPEVELAKMENITRLFEHAFDRKPTSFRAGRFSAGANTIRCLETLGYKVDTSVTPHVNWKDRTREQPVDYRPAPEQPYFTRENAYPKDDPNGHILEVPVSIVKKRRFLILTKPVWLRPYVSTTRELSAVVEDQTRRHKTGSKLVFNMMFHNVEVLPGLSPYPQTESEAKSYIESLESFLKYCGRNNIRSVGLTDLHGIFSDGR